MHQEHHHEQLQPTLANYFPLLLIAAYIIVVVTINNFASTGVNWSRWMNQFMAGFFLIFSFFKFLNLTEFANLYARYDLLAKRLPIYGYIYPFLELGLGLLYVGIWFPVTTYILTIIIMSFSALGVFASLLNKQRLQCACLGAVINLPLSNVTLIEDILMVFMAILSLYGAH